MAILVWLSNANPDIFFPVDFLSLPGLLAILSQINTYLIKDPRRLVDFLLQLQCSELCLLLSTHNCFPKCTRKLPYFFLIAVNFCWFSIIYHLHFFLQHFIALRFHNKI